MAPKIHCPSCGYPYRMRSQRSKCPKCGYKLSQDQAKGVAIAYIAGIVIALIVYAVISSSK